MQVLRNSDGFTLIEILIATVIISVASLGVADLTVGIMRGNSFSQRLTTAATLAQDRLEQIKRIGYQNVGTLVGTENYGDIDNYSGYKRVTSTADNSLLPMRIVTVEVSWKVSWKTAEDPEKDPHVTLSIILAE
jgi:prepilin-type N-terminal cleavage/methylation domain-containing protein